MHTKNRAHCFSAFAAYEYQKRLTKFKLATLKFIIPCWRPTVYAHVSLPTMHRAQTRLSATLKIVDRSYAKLLHLTTCQIFHWKIQDFTTGR